ncbi:MAG TPA: L-fucose/L-arabinose isomerase family protein [Sedimentisphaerales bacterium]|nr:L-fucose/L-arabinose isomerase family protein [Sedimentisphaerales bacterium]
MKKMTFGIIVGNRGFFPAHLAKEGRDAILKVLSKAGHNAVVLSGKDTQYGAVVTLEDAKKCADLFKANAEKIDGIILTLPNFGEEKGILETMKRCGLQVPVLIQAEPDTEGRMTIKDRRDSFCGKISACNNLRQAGVPYTLTRNHTVGVESSEFACELEQFAAVCRVVKGLTNCRIGAIGARPAAFNTVRYSEKLLEMSGITVETLDLSEVIGQIERMVDKDRAVTAKLAAIKKYVRTDGIPAESLLKIAKFAVVVDRFIKENEINATAIQCWTSLETYFGITPCTLMSMMSEGLVPSACEVDVTGAVSMYALQCASGVPSALLDWNNNYGDDPEKCILFHCSNLPKSFFIDLKMDYQEIIAGTVGKENTYGTVVGRVRASDATFCRVTTDDVDGVISCYVGQGQFTKDKMGTFGGYGVMRIPNLQTLMQYICRMGFEHHVAVSMSSCADAIAEAMDTYMGWEVYRHI